MRLLVTVDRLETTELFSGSLKLMKHRPELLDLWTDVLETPAGFPVDVLVQVDRSTDNGSIEIKSNGVLLLQAGPLRAGFQTILMLPTEEKLTVMVLHT